MNARVTRLSGGWCMVEPMSRLVAESMYDLLDKDELDEINCLGTTKEMFIDACVNADRSAAFYNDMGKLMFTACANWIDLNGETVRLWDTMSSKTVREEGLVRQFIMHSNEMCDAFASGEPSDKIVGIVKSDFMRSRKWIERVLGWEEVGAMGIKNIWHTVYRKVV